MSEAAIDRDEVASAARMALDDLSSSSAVRAIVDPHDEQRREQLWQKLVKLGWTGIEVPEEFGGAGAGFGDLASILIELGAHLTPSPLFATAVLGVGVLVHGRGTERDRWLRAIADGSARATAALAGPGTEGRSRAVGALGGIRLSGSWPYVPDADVADVILAAGVAEDGDHVVVALDRHAVDVSVQEVAMFDLTRRLFTVSADDLPVPDEAVMARGDRAARLLGRVRDRAALATACDSLGVAQRVLAVTTEYVRQRVQFDRPIGSFQAVKHKCTDMLIAVQTSRVVVDEAIRALDEAEFSPEIAVSMAKAYACDAAAQVAAHGVTLHGGIGFTWEHDMHLYLKRAKLNQALYGASRTHWRRIADLGLPAGG